MKKRVLTLLSAFNGERFIERQIVSILEQETEHEVRLRVRDDGSSDRTCEIVEAVMQRYPGRIELQRGENIGPDASFFALLRDADGADYYALSDQDDVWLPEKLQVAVDALEEHRGVPALYAAVSTLVDGELKPFGTTRQKQRPFSMYNTIIQNICPGHTQVVNGELLALLKEPLDMSRIYAYDAWITNVAMLYGVLVFDPQPHVLYRQHDRNFMGYGKGALGMLKASQNRAKRGDGARYREQIRYFVELNREKLAATGQLQELDAFLGAKTFPQRLRYVCKSRLYRQSRMETLAFYAAVVSGSF